MERSFRDILSELLEGKPEEQAPSPGANQSSTPPEMSFVWQAPELKHTPKKTYAPSQVRLQERERAPAPAKTTPPKRPAESKKEEPVTPLKQLREPHLKLVRHLIEMGAWELEGGLSPTRLKKAHRRLAKRLHPDTQAAGTPEKEKERSRALFLNLQSAYEKTLKILPLYAPSASACGTESASAPGCRRQDAA